MTWSIVYELPIADDLVASFQRYPYPGSGWLAALPRSLGAMPVAVEAGGSAAVPCPPGEALWIGLVPTGPVPTGAGLPVRARRVRATALRGGPAGSGPAPLGTEEPLLVPPAFAAEGVVRGDGAWWALARETSARGAPPCRAVELAVLDGGPGAVPRSVHVDLVDAEEFHALTGARVPPPREADAYGGWRLP